MLPQAAGRPYPHVALYPGPWDISRCQFWGQLGSGFRALTRSAMQSDYRSNPCN